MSIACDTGAPCTLVPASFYNKSANKKPLRECRTPYVSYNGDKIKIVGEYDATIEYRGVQKEIVVVVTNTKSPPLLGRTFLRSFNFELRQINSVKESEIHSNIIDKIKVEFAEVFSPKLGCYNVHKITLQVEPDTKPIFFKPRPLPLAWKDKVDKQLRKLVNEGVLEHVDNSDWGTPLVPILKPNGDIRICGDYKVTLNKHLVDVKYPLPRIDDIFAALTGGILFSKLDLSNAYNQLQLDESSQRMCTWSTHIGLLKVKRLPFGIKSAAAIFQKAMESLFQGIPGVVVYQDDITITGRNFQEHITNLKIVLNKLKSVGLKLNTHKCEFFKSKICYLGFMIDKNGLSKTNDRKSSVSLAPTPRNVSELRAFIGMVNYYSKFINNFAQKMNPLYELLRKGTQFEWTSSCQKAYEEIKSEITSEQVLVHYDPELPIVLTTDASNNAVAGILSHKIDNDLKPIAFVSRSLSKSEINYSTFEKEALAIVYCVVKLRQYLLGTKFILRTDHKPLLGIFGESKGLPLMASARIQRWSVILSGFEYSVEYVKGASNLADGLSRMPQWETHKDFDEFNYVNFIQSNNSFNLSFKDIAKESRRDPVLAKVAEAIQNGTISKLKGNEFSAYVNKSCELSIEYDCILWGYRVVVPSKLQKKILSEFHKSHLGIVKTKMMARSYVWWPAINLEIEKMIRSCIPCQELQASPEKGELIPWKSTDTVWSRIHVDFAGPIKNYYLFIVIDSFTKWVEVFKTKEITTLFTINKLREVFCRYGLVDVLVSDNGRQFTSAEFQTFMKNNNVKHILTAPGHPSTNGQAENFVKTVKKSLYANIKENENCEFDTMLNRFLIDYRNTVHCTTGESPAKLFFGRSLKTRFTFLKPPTVTKQIEAKQNKSISDYKGKRNITFRKGQKVMVRDYKNPNKASWTQATINEQLGPRSYCCILSHNNREIKRHLDQIRNENMETNNEVATEVTNNNEVVNSNDSTVENQVYIEDENNQLPSELNTSPTRRELRPRQGGRVVKKTI
nr:uncharacterized protein K02A2.6-like [Drosophila kikkawai]